MRMVTIASPVVVLAAVLLATPALAQTPSGKVTEAELTSYSRMPEAQQRTGVPRERMQAWFVDMVERWQHFLEPAAVASLVDLGKSAGYRKLLAPPTGSGPADWTLVWRTTRRGPMKEPGEPFYFPDDMVALCYTPTNIAEHAYCWHELQHGILAEHSLISPGNDVVDQEHAYITGLGQATVAWLHQLTKVNQFEKLVVEADALSKTYVKRGERVDKALERHIWGRCHESWRKSYALVRDMAPLTVAMRQEYQRLAGVSTPTVEEVIRFYMGGGVGKIKVPRWVFSTDPPRELVLIDIADAKSRADKGIARHAVKLRVREYPYSWMGPGRIVNRLPVTRGKLSIRLEDDDSDAWLGLALNGKPVKGVAVGSSTSVRTFTADLAALKSDVQAADGFALSLFRQNLAELRGEKRYRIVVDYVDGRDASGDAVYDPSRAIFYVVFNKGQQAPPAGWRASSRPAQASTPTGPSTPRHRGPAWYLVGTRAVKDTARLGGGRTAPGSISATSGSYSVPFSNEWQEGVDSWSASWTAPPSVLKVGDTVSGTLTVSNAGSTVRNKQDSKPRRLSSSVSCRIFYRDRSVGAGTSASAAIDLDRPENAKPSDTVNYSWRVFAPADEKKMQVGFQFGVYYMMYDYDYRDDTPPPPKSSTATTKPAASAPPTSVSSEVVVAEAPKPREDPRLSDTPPEDGEEVPVVKDRKTPPKPPTPKERWYTHARGDYRMPLPRGWSIREGSGTGVDTLTPEDVSVIVRPGRSYAEITGLSVDKALQRAVDALRGKRPDPVTSITVGGAPGRVITTYDAKDKCWLWHVLFLQADRCYYIGITLPDSSGPAPEMPARAASMLNGVRFTR